MNIHTIHSSRDLLLFELDSAVASLRETLADLTDAEYHWEPLPPEEQGADRFLPADQKRAWRVYPHTPGNLPAAQTQAQGIDVKTTAWTYDYTPEPLAVPAFTTIAWIMSHIAQTADMYLYCVKTGKPEGPDRLWDDLPVPPDRQAMTGYIFQALQAARDYLVSIPAETVEGELNRLTPAPWGELRPTYLNLWGGIVEHAVQHAMQIGARKDRIRYGY